MTGDAGRPAGQDRPRGWERLRRLLRRAAPAGAAEQVLVTPIPWACAISHVGMVRSGNEDTCGVSADGRVLVVADGMGGHRAGEVASALAAEVVLEALSQVEVSAGVLEETIRAVHARVRDAARSRADWLGMGTTLAVAAVAGDTLLVGGVGDSRVYRFADGRLEQLTEDHSVVARLVRAGMLSAAEAWGHPRRNELVQAIGLSDEVSPSLGSCSLGPGDQVLVCSDGLWGEVAAEAIAGVLASAIPPADRAAMLVEAACMAGGHDNVTVALYEHRPVR